MCCHFSKRINAFIFPSAYDLAVAPLSAEEECSPLVGSCGHQQPTNGGSNRWTHAANQWRVQQWDPRFLEHFVDFYEHDLGTINVSNNLIFLSETELIDRF